ncbi:MAG: ABC transporter substrate-binding protein [Bacteroidia bacterium]|nr:ABC transporter substrate-binding protein [Bacteroidia bacterium]MDW8301322.1 ABC transporter substrate-binding protein [Bacteroidia bacterium]
MKWLSKLAIILGSLCFLGCPKPEKNKIQNYSTTQKDPSFGDWVVLGILTEPDNLNPFMGISAYSMYIFPFLYQSLTVLDYVTNVEKPLLSQDLPTVSEDGLRYTYQIRPDAIWDNGSPILAEDILFTLKAVLHPYTQTDVIKPYFATIKDIELYPDNPRKITFILKEKYILSRYVIGSMYVLPRYIYDEGNRMAKFSFTDVVNGREKLKNNSDFMKFAEEFNDPTRMRNPKFLTGSGAYLLEKWDTQQQVILKRKTQWWGYKHSHEHSAFQAYPDKIIYKITGTVNTAITEMKAGNLDVMFGIPPKDFDEIKQNPIMKQHFNFYTNTQLAFMYIGLNNLPKNNTHPALADVKVRRALAYLTEVDKMLEKIYYNYGTRLSTIGLNNNKEMFNPEFKPIPYDVEKAKELLDEAGWKDTDNNGIRDKVINGKKYELTFEFITVSGSVTNQNIALMMQQSVKPAGIKINVVNQEGNVFIQRLKNRDFDLYASAWTLQPAPFDPYQIFHSKSIEGGSNFIGFHNTQADKLIEQIRRELNSDKRKKLYYELQKIIYQEQPYIFLWQPKERIIIHKRFQNQVIFDANPGFAPNMFWTPKEYIKYK